MSAERSFNFGKTNVVAFIICFLGFFELIYSKPFNETSTISNLTVSVFEDTTYVDNEDHGPLKFNIAWNVLVNKRKPSSYSILITSLNKHDDDGSIKLCPEETLFYTTSDGNRCHVVLPENHFFSEAPELSIRPACTYGIQVFANPRNNPKAKVPEVILEVPKCVGGWCACEEADEFLLVPEIDIVSQTSEDIEVKWTVGSSDSRVNSYVISFGVPFLISNNRLPVYNISKIASVPSNVSSYSWSLCDSNLDVTAGGQIYIAAEDSFGCTGKPGVALIQVPVQALSSIQQNGRWLVWVSLIGMSLMVLGAAVSFLYNRSRPKYEFLWGNRATLRIQGLMGLSRLRSRWIDSTLQERNVLYVEQEIQYAISRGQADEFEVSYKRLKFIRELGKGEFGKVYLGTLEGHPKSLVAIKISNCTEASAEPEARRQLLAEIETMKNAGPHPHLVGLIATCTLPDKPVCVVLEYLEGGDLLAYLRRLRNYLTNRIFQSGLPISSSPRPSFSEST